MPTYEFQCPKCSQRFEVVRPRDKAGAPAKCPVDGASARRVFSAGGILTPGGGSGESDHFDSLPGGTDWGEGGDFGMGEGGMGGGEDFGGGDFGGGHSHGPGGHTH